MAKAGGIALLSFGRGFQGAHDALQDANAVTDCYPN